ncbi:MAG: DUF3047 domain-containing protein [Polaromonas sp.]|nr:DUF3047 domain-containing protein [Polaromonas sp.]
MTSAKFFKFLRFVVFFSSLAGLGLLTGCAGSAGLAGLAGQADNASDSPNASAVRTTTPWDVLSVRAADASKASFWQHRTFPGKAQNQFAYLQLDGRNAMGVKSSASASMLRKVVSMEPAQLDALRFSWKVPALIADADMALRDKDDAPVRLVLAFDGDRSKLSARDRMLSELAYAVTGEDMPYATLMYVWCNQREPGSVVLNPRTDRIRKLVLESGPKKLNRWLDYERDIRADYLKVFGEEPGRLIAVGIMTDTDNTKSTAEAWYGPVVLGQATAPESPRLTTSR